MLHKLMDAIRQGLAAHREYERFTAESGKKLAVQSRKIANKLARVLGPVFS
jgi:hypothetical protein